MRNPLDFLVIVLKNRVVKNKKAFLFLYCKKVFKIDFYKMKIFLAEIKHNLKIKFKRSIIQKR